MKRPRRGRSRPPSALRAAASIITFRQKTRLSAKSSTKACVSSTTPSRRHWGSYQPARHRAVGSRPPSRRICCHRSSTAIIRRPASAPLRFCPTLFANGCRIERRRYEALWAQLVGELYQAGLIDPNISPESIRVAVARRAELGRRMVPAGSHGYRRHLARFRGKYSAWQVSRPQRTKAASKPDVR